MVIRMFMFLVTLFCLVASFYRGQFDGVSVVGLLAFAGFLWTFGVFSRGFWVDASVDASLSAAESARVRAALEAARKVGGQS